jgi:hypothetical protein
LLSRNDISIAGTEPKATINLLHKYIAENWFKHAELAAGSNILELPEDLNNWISPLFKKGNDQAFSNWIQVYDPDILQLQPI